MVTLHQHSGNVKPSRPQRIWDFSVYVSTHTTTDCTTDKGQREAYKTVDATKDKISGAINHKI